MDRIVEDSLTTLRGYLRSFEEHGVDSESIDEISEVLFLLGRHGYLDAIPGVSDAIKRQIAFDEAWGKTKSLMAEQGIGVQRKLENNPLDELDYTQWQHRSLFVEFVGRSNARTFLDPPSSELAWPGLLNSGVPMPGNVVRNFGNDFAGANRVERDRAVEGVRRIISIVERASDSSSVEAKLARIKAATDKEAEIRKEKSLRGQQEHELTQTWAHVAVGYFKDHGEFARDLLALAPQFRKWGFADRIAGFERSLDGDAPAMAALRLFLRMLAACCDENPAAVQLQEKYLSLCVHFAENSGVSLQEVVASAFDGIGFRETQHAIQKGTKPPTWDELRRIKSSSQSKDPVGERESQDRQPTLHHIPCTKPNANEDSDNSPVPLFDSRSRDWVPADEISQKYDVRASTLADYRSATRRREAQVDAVGFWFRSDPKKPSNEPPYYYWPQAEKVIAAKNEKKKAKTRKRN